MIALAFRYLAARPRQTFLMLLGFFFGTAAFVLLSGVMLGFRQYLVYQLVNNDAQVYIQAREEFLTEKSLDKAFFGPLADLVRWDVPPSGRKDSARVENPEAWYERLSNDPRVEAFTPQLSASVILSKGRITVPAVLVGCDPLRQMKVTTIGDYITEGRFEDLAAGGNRAAIGAQLKKRLGVTLGQNVLISLSEGKQMPFKVAAVFETGNHHVDDQAFGSIADVQAVNLTPNEVNQIAVRLKDYKTASKIADAWSALSEEKVESWDQKFSNIFSVFRIQDMVRFLSIGAIMVVAGFGMYNVLNIMVTQKRRDIAILRSMGYAASDVVQIFFIQGLVLGTAGAVLGLSFGYLLSFYLETIRISAGGPVGIGIDHLLVSREPAIYIQSAALALSSASIASILPAASAGRLSPIQIIRTTVE